MGQYRIFQPTNMYDKDIYDMTLSSFAKIHRNYDNAYAIMTAYKKPYLIIDGPLGNISLNRMFIDELSPECFVQSINSQLVNIQYQNDDNNLICKKMEINPCLNDFCCNTQRIPMILISNDEKTSIDFYSICDVIYPNKITETYTVGDIIPKYKAIYIKKILSDNKDEMYHYIISKIIDKHCPSKRYEVKI